MTVWRVHTCDDGSGSFTAFMPFARAEHGGNGSWKIVEGTGRYAQLRGQGTYVGTLLSGDPNVFSTIAYRAQWQGVVDFDADPPVIESLSASARKLSTRVRRYTLRISVTARDASSPISYTVNVRAGTRPPRVQERLDDIWAGNSHASYQPASRRSERPHQPGCDGRGWQRTNERVADDQTR